MNWNAHALPSYIQIMLVKSGMIVSKIKTRAGLSSVEETGLYSLRSVTFDVGMAQRETTTRPASSILLRVLY